MAKTVFKLKPSETETLVFADEDIISLEWEQQATSNRTTAIYDLYAVYGKVELQDKGLVLYNKALNGEFDEYEYPIELFVNNTKVGSFVVTELPNYSYADKTLSLTFGDRLSIADSSIYEGYDYPEKAQTLDTIFEAVIKAFDTTLTDEQVNTILSKSIYSSTQTFAQYLATISIPYPYIEPNNSFRTAFKQILTVAQAALITDCDIGYRLIRMDGRKACKADDIIAILSDKTTSQLVPTVILPNKYNVCEVEAKKGTDEIHNNEPFVNLVNQQVSVSQLAEPDISIKGRQTAYNDATNGYTLSTGLKNYGEAYTSIDVSYDKTKYVGTEYTISKKQDNALKRLRTLLELPETQILATITYKNQELVFDCSGEGIKEAFYDDGYLTSDLLADMSHFPADENAISKKETQFKIKLPISSIKAWETFGPDEWTDTREYGGESYTQTFPECKVTLTDSFENGISVFESGDNIKILLSLRLAHNYVVYVVNSIVDISSSSYPYVPVRAVKYRNNAISATLDIQYNAEFYQLTFTDNTVTVKQSNGIKKENKVSISGGGTLMQYPNSTHASNLGTNTLVTFSNGLNGGTLECSSGDYFAFSGTHEKRINYLTTNESNETTKYKKFFEIGDIVVPCKDRNYTPIMTRPQEPEEEKESEEIAAVLSYPVYFQVVKNAITFNGGSFSQQLTLREVK